MSNREDSAMTIPGSHPATSPVVYSFNDYQSNAISIKLTFDNTTRTISQCTVTRDPACVYTKIYVGLGVDGTPNTTPRVFTVPIGTTNVPLNQLRNNGISTIEDFLSYQVTAGP
jgi:hypothetical protein